MNQFIGVLTDPFIAGPRRCRAPATGATGFAEESERFERLRSAGRKRTRAERDA